MDEDIEMKRAPVIFPGVDLSLWLGMIIAAVVASLATLIGVLAVT